MVLDMGISAGDGGPFLMDLRYRRDWLGQSGVFTKRHVPKLNAGRVAAIVVDVSGFSDIALLNQEVSESGGRFRLAARPADVPEGWDVPVLFLGGTHTAVGNDPKNLKLLRDLGMRFFLFSGNTRNLLVDGCGERNAAGLSRLGMSVARRLQELGVIIDVSHMSEAGFWDIANSVSIPFVASHSNARALADNPRNLTDEQIVAIAKSGGYVGISQHPTLIRKGGPASIEDLLDHIDYLVKLAGADHVSLGADFIDHCPEFVVSEIKKSDPDDALYAPAAEYLEKELYRVSGIRDVSELPNILEGLRKRGYDSNKIRKIARENFIRVLTSV